MSQITYKEDIKIKVYLEKKLIGQIKKVPGGWQYVPNAGMRFAGEVMPTLEAVKTSIESD